MFTVKSFWTPIAEEIGINARETIAKIEDITDKVLSNYTQENDQYYIKIITPNPTPDQKIDRYYINNLAPNLTKGQRQAIFKLRNNPNIIIKLADKGALTCILNKTAYVKEAFRQQNNQKYYSRNLPSTQKTDLCTTINTILGKIHTNCYINSPTI